MRNESMTNLTRWHTKKQNIVVRRRLGLVWGRFGDQQAQRPTPTVRGSALGNGFRHNFVCVLLSTTHPESLLQLIIQLPSSNCQLLSALVGCTSWKLVGGPARGFHPANQPAPADKAPTNLQQASKKCNRRVLIGNNLIINN